jgi:transcriptional regulator with XRE-family HTH domain
MTRRNLARYWQRAAPLAEMIREGRRAAGLTQEELAEKCGYTRGGGRFVALWEQGLQTPPAIVGPILCPLIGLDRLVFYRALRSLRPQGA